MKRIILLLLILLSVLLNAENEIGREKVEFKDKEVEKSVRVFLKDLKKIFIKTK